MSNRTINELAATALQEACASSFPALPDLEGQPNPIGIAAIIGLAGDDVRCTLAIGADAAGLEIVRDEAGASGSQAEDSLGEIANLVAGHLKRRLIQ